MTSMIPRGTTLAVERGQLVAQIDRSRVRLEEIDAALERLGRGAYGRCETCGEPIDPRTTRGVAGRAAVREMCRAQSDTSLVSRYRGRIRRRVFMPNSAEDAYIVVARE